MSNELSFPYTYEFITEDEFMAYSLEEIQKVQSKDGHHFTIYGIKEKDLESSVIIAYDDGQVWNEMTWQLIQLGPRYDLGTKDVKVNDQLRPLIVVTGENEDDNIMAVNDGYILVEVGFDGEIINDIANIIGQHPHYGFFNALAWQIINFITNPEFFDDDNNEI